MINAHASFTVERIGKGVYALEASCKGCLLSAAVEDWTSGTDAAARTERSLTSAQWSRSAKDHDAVELVVDESPGLFAVDVVALLEPTAGIIVEHRETQLGEIDAGGAVRFMDWSDWICASTYAACFVNDEGDDVIDLDPQDGVQP